ncbi:hypothetical protein N5V60_23390 [Escherichia coli]|nr:hypothetical protein [Escherichia coli]
MIGGVYVSLIDALYQAIEELKLDDRPINWDDIKNKPELYPPEPHIHHVSAIYGTEHLCLAIYSLKAAILIGDAASDNRLWAAIDQLRKDMQAADKDLTDLHYAHANRTDNPHEVTKAQVGLGNVQNYPTANKAEAEAGTAPDRYMTAQTVGWAIAKLAGDLVDAHANRRDNPHSVTKAQVNLGNVDNFPTASDDEAKAGTANNRFMTPLRTVAAIEQFALIPLNAHKADYNNPHRVTKAQVGLGNVQDFAVATDTQAADRTNQTAYMTPYSTYKSIAAFAALADHTHTAEQVGALPISGGKLTGPIDLSATSITGTGLGIDGANGSINVNKLTVNQLLEAYGGIESSDTIKILNDDETPANFLADGDLEGIKWANINSQEPGENDEGVTMQKIGKLSDYLKNDYLTSLKTNAAFRDVFQALLKEFLANFNAVIKAKDFETL